MIKIAGTDAASWVGLGTGKTPVPTAAPTGSAHVSRPNTGTSGGAAPAKNNQEVEDVVRTMQNLMGDLGTQLSKAEVAQEVVNRIKSEQPDSKLDAAYIQSQALKFSRTAANVQYAAPGDGQWGKNTKDALVAVKAFAEALKLQNVIITEGTGISPRKEMKPEELISAARSNINNISRVFSALGIESKVAGIKGTEGMVVVDSIDPTLPEEATTEPFKYWGNRPVTMSDLSDFENFFRFIQALKPVWPCEMLEGGAEKQDEIKPAPTPAQAAKEILDGSIIRLADLATQRGHCVNVMDKIIDWFYDRSNTMFDSLYETYRQSLPSPRPDRKGKISTENDARLGKYYVEQMKKIADVWDNIRESVINYLRTHGHGKNPVVTSRVLREAVNSSKTTGKAHTKRDDKEDGRRSDKSRSRGRTYTPEGDEYSEKPPLARFMSLKRFNVPAMEQLRQLSSNGRVPEINLEDWRGGNWATQSQFIEGASDAEKFARFEQWAQAIRNVIIQVYNQWSADDRPDAELKDQYRLLQNWLDAIKSMIRFWTTNHKEAIHRARQGI